MQLEIGKFYKDTRGMFSVVTEKVTNSTRRPVSPKTEFYTNRGWDYTSDGVYIPYQPDAVDISQQRRFNLVEEVAEQTIRDWYNAHAFHPEIGLDESVSQDKSIAPYQFILDPMSNPHRHRELNLMKAGYKPLAIITQKDFDQHWSEICKQKGWVHKHLTEGRFHVVHVAPKEEAWRIDVLAMSSVCHRELKDPTVDFHSLTGRLLGYRMKDIAYWKGEPYDE